jgi:uncharacterized protein YndB with AHSA1/START domain
MTDTFSTVPSATGTSADREIVLTRVINAPRELIFEALGDKENIGTWWGPNGFRTTTHEMSFVTGGIWRYTMHGPDGTDYPNYVIYDEIVPPEKIVYTHGSHAGDENAFISSILLEDLGGTTRVTISSLFQTVEARNFVVENFGAIEGGEQTLARMAEFVESLK